MSHIRHLILYLNYFLDNPLLFLWTEYVFIMEQLWQILNMKTSLIGICTSHSVVEEIVLLKITFVWITVSKGNLTWEQCSILLMKSVNCLCLLNCGFYCLSNFLHSMSLPTYPPSSSQILFSPSCTFQLWHYCLSLKCQYWIALLLSYEEFIMKTNFV